MRVVVIGAVALPLVLGGVIVAAAAINSVEDSSPSADSAPRQSQGSALTGAPKSDLDVPLSAVSGDGTPINGQRPHLTVIDGATNILIPGSLASIISMLPRTTVHFSADAASLDDVDLGGSGHDAQVPAAPVAPAEPSHSMLSRSEQPYVVPPPSSPAPVVPGTAVSPVSPPAPAIEDNSTADDEYGPGSPNGDHGGGPIAPPGQAAGGQWKPEGTGPPPHALETGTPDHAGTTGPAPHANTGGNGNGNRNSGGKNQGKGGGFGTRNGMGNANVRADTVSTPR